MELDPGAPGAGKPSIEFANREMRSGGGGDGVCGCGEARRDGGEGARGFDRERDFGENNLLSYCRCLLGFVCLDAAWGAGLGSLRPGVRVYAAVSLRRGSCFMRGPPASEGSLDPSVPPEVLRERGALQSLIAARTSVL